MGKTLCSILRSSHGRSSVKKEFLKTSPNSEKITCVRLTFLRDSDIGVFLLVLWSFLTTPFSQNISGGCFCILLIIPSLIFSVLLFLKWLKKFAYYPLINLFCALIFKMAEEICLRKSAISVMMSDNLLVVNLSIAGKSRRATKFRKSTEKDNF